VSHYLVAAWPAIREQLLKATHSCQSGRRIAMDGELQKFFDGVNLDIPVERL
jgi:hypothetical protein